MTRSFPALLGCGVLLVAAACGDSGTDPANPTTTLTSVSPAGGAADVDISAPIVLTFSGAMGSGMEALMDLHMGTAAAGTMPMTCTWSADRTTVTCTHAAFANGAMYTMHVGGGMMDADGQPVGMGYMMAQMGGVWLTSGMMGGMHAGQPMGSMGTGWMGANGSYGMMFTFTTA
ncbi:MAG TPA: Ig-like domain-containing protein [Gemmatimonadales bacterium]|nr:Ig-like domain-containing protein [Gemmatimonadales bacterium]HRZ08519.1 Ig-like domain-containing protein [Gemmatimonadales bacterium]